MNFIEVFKLILSLFPLIINAVKTLEAFVPAQGKGAEKLEMLKTMLTTSYEASDKAYGTFEQVWPVIQSTVTGIVNMFNSTGLFKKAN